MKSSTRDFITPAERLYIPIKYKVKSFLIDKKMTAKAFAEKIKIESENFKNFVERGYKNVIIRISKA